MKDTRLESIQPTSAFGLVAPRNQVFGANVQLIDCLLVQYLRLEGLTRAKIPTFLDQLELGVQAVLRLLLTSNEWLTHYPQRSHPIWLLPPAIQGMRLHVAIGTNGHTQQFHAA
jgi:hypothetical protein